MSTHTVSALVPFADDHMAVTVTFSYRPDPADDEVEFVSAAIAEPGVVLNAPYQRRLEEWCEAWLSDEGQAEALDKARADIHEERLNAYHRRQDEGVA